MSSFFIDKEHTVVKSYSFKKGKVELIFQLRVDKESELAAFEVLLEEALSQVRKDIEHYEGNK
jgi:hypothetical protein